MDNPNFQSGTDVFDDWRDDLLTGTPPVLYPVGDGELARLEIGPKLVTLLGGPPGVGKTAFVMQAVTDALRLTPSLRALVANVETSPSVLLDRQLARLSGISAGIIRYRKLGASHADRLDAGLGTLEDIAPRLAFVKPPFDLANIAASADAFGAQLLLLDYIQRIPPPGQHGDRRGSIDATMGYLRQFADAGVAVVMVAALARQKDGRGRSSYHQDALTLASFRESSELEFGSDDCFILSSDPKADSVVTLRHLKARHTEPRDIALRFDRKRQSFTPLDPTNAKKTPKGKLEAALPTLWNQTELADDEGDGNE